MPNNSPMRVNFGASFFTSKSDLSADFTSHKSHNASDKYPTMHHFVTEMWTRAHFCYKMVHCGIWDGCIVGFVWQVLCTFLLQNGALWVMGQVHCGICMTGLLLCCMQHINFNSMWPSDAICLHRSESTLTQVMACLTTPSHWPEPILTSH